MIKIKHPLKLEQIIPTANVAELLNEDDLTNIGLQVVHDFEMDKSSRADWEDRTKTAMELALQVAEDKTFPWEGASNVKFPLITIAALQWHTRAYPALISGTDIVKCKVVGPDANGHKSDRAVRVAQHMSYQVLEEDMSWEDQMDKTLISLPIIGSAFKKSYFDPSLDHNVSINIFAKDLVVDYFTKSLETAQRITHIIELNSNQIYERTKRKLFSELTLSSVPQVRSDGLEEVMNEVQGTQPSINLEDAPHVFLEQHRYLDLDGDGYQEPYIVTVHKETNQVARIVARFTSQSIERNADNEIIQIKPQHYFTKYSFVPSPDGGFYDLGFGVLLGPLNESINTLINQLIDAGTMSNTGGGFLGRGVKLRGGDQSFKPMEWKRTDSTGDDLRKGIFPLPVREPSQVLFTLLQLLIGYGERMAGATEIMTGISPGQNTPAETSRNTMEQGSKVFNGIFKRVWRSLREEFRKLYSLNQLFLPEIGFFADQKGNQFQVSANDYSDVNEIAPAADPDVVSDSQRLQQAMMIKQAATSSPGWDLYQVDKDFLTALKVKNPDRLRPDPKGPNAIQPMPNPKVQIEQMKQQEKMARLQLDQQEFQFNQQVKMMELAQEVEMNRAKILELEAKALLALEQAGGIKEGHQIALLDAQIGAAKQKQEGLMKSIDTIKRVLEITQMRKESQNDQQRGMGSLEGASSNQGVLPTSQASPGGR